jgi:hypothetical protein
VSGSSINACISIALSAFTAASTANLCTFTLWAQTAAQPSGNAPTCGILTPFLST